MSERNLSNLEVISVVAAGGHSVEQNWRSTADSVIMELAELLGELVAAEEAKCEGDD